MRIISVNVGLPREVTWQGRRIRTGIFKEPVRGPVRLCKLNVDGDGQADLSVHGGPSKAVYAYPFEHYDYWKNELPDMRLTCGMFGENLTIEGLLEKEVDIGDRFRIGQAEVVATEPRVPCFKLGVKFGRPDMVKRFLLSRRTGFYFAVLREGEIKAGDAMERLGRDSSDVSVADIIRLYAFEKGDPATLWRIARLQTLPESWRNYFRQRLESPGGYDGEVQDLATFFRIVR